MPPLSIVDGTPRRPKSPEIVGAFDVETRAKLFHVALAWSSVPSVKTLCAERFGVTRQHVYQTLKNPARGPRIVTEIDAFIIEQVGNLVQTIRPRDLPAVPQAA